ncbi:YncE family protein [Clostridium tertium]
MEEKELVLNKGEKPLGPTGLCIKDKRAYIANSYSNSMSIIDIEAMVEEDVIYVGANPNDLVRYEDKIYIVCSESNTVVLYDIEEKRIILDIKVNNWPYNIEISETYKLLFITNFQSHNISIIDINTNKVVGELVTLEYPTKIKVSKDGKHLYVCESYMGDISNGYIEIFNLITLKSLGKIEVGKVPIDIFEDRDSLYISNLLDGSIYCLDIETFDLIKEINIGGMPRGVIKVDNLMYVMDYLKGRIICVDLKTNETKVITVGKEPNAMTLY